MRTLKEIDEQILADSKEVIQRLNEAEDGPLMIPEGDALWLQQETRFGEKYREMYAILKDVEKFFVNDVGSAVKRENEKQALLNRLHNL